MPGPPVNRAPRSFSSAGSDSLDDCVHTTVGSAARTERTALAGRAVLEGRRRVVAMLFQSLSAKLGIVTGRNLAELCRERFSRPVALAMWVVSEIAAMATD